MVSLHDRVRRQHTFNIAKPICELPVPVDRHPQSSVETRALLPAQRLQFAAVDRIPPVVEFPVARVLNPGRLVGQVEEAEQFLGQLQVGDFVARVDVVGFADLALMQYCIESFGCVAGVEVAARVLAVAVEEKWPASAEEADEFRYHLCVVLAWLRRCALARFAYFLDTVASVNWVRRFSISRVLT
jgi:hypothetical protein